MLFRSNIPAASASVDAVTVAFGIRNVQNTQGACDEIFRVLNGGGRLAVLEFAIPTTPGVRALAEKLGPVDVAIVVYQVHAIADTQIQYTMPFVELFKPKLFLPAHHDSAPPAWIDLGLEPMFDAIREKMPDTRFLAPLYRSPICVSASGPNKGAVTSFRY